MKRKISILATAATIAAGTLLTGCGTVNTSQLLGAAVQATQAMTVSDVQIQSYVSQYIAQMDQQNTVAPASDKYAKRLARLTAPLTNIDGLPLNFKVYKTSDANAFACADGSVRVYSGLMDIMDDEELLGVIGHEIGHVAHKDSKRAFQQALMNSAIASALGSTGGTLASLTSGQLGQLSQQYLSARFSRQQENAADDFGYDFLKAAGINPVAMARAFYRLRELENASGATAQNSGLAMLFSTHPDLDERINRMAERAQKDGYLK